MAHDLQSYRDFATATARQAGTVTLEYFQRPDLGIEHKADDSPVTIADRRAEQLVRERISKTFPHHAVVGEEFGTDGPPDAEARWYIDPIDGTRAFARGVPLYAVLLGLEIRGRCEVGVAYFPALDEMLTAASGLGCAWNGTPARVSPVTSLAQGILTHANVAAFERIGAADTFRRLSHAAGFTAGWADAYAYLLVATGRAEVAIDPVMSPWDCGPFPVILREAGGYFGDWTGSETIHSSRTLATTSALLPSVLDLLAAS